MKLNLLIALAAGGGALVGPQPQLKKAQSLAFAPALDVCDDIDAMRVDVRIDNKFHHRFHQCKNAWKSRLARKRLERDDVFRDVFDRLKWISYRSRQPSDTLGPYLAIVKRPPKARLAA